MDNRQRDMVPVPEQPERPGYRAPKQKRLSNSRARPYHLLESDKFIAGCKSMAEAKRIARNILGMWKPEEANAALKFSILSKATGHVYDLQVAT